MLFPATWGAVGGALVVRKIVADPSFQAEVMKRLPEAKTDVKKMPPNEKKRLTEGIVKERFKEANWLPVHLIVNFVTFSMLGFLAGILLKEFSFSGIIPLVMLFFTLPTLASTEFMVKSKTVTISIGLLTQTLSVYLFAFVGTWIRNLVSRKKEQKVSVTENGLKSGEKR